MLYKLTRLRDFRVILASSYIDRSYCSQFLVHISFHVPLSMFMLHDPKQNVHLLQA